MNRAPLVLRIDDCSVEQLGELLEVDAVHGFRYVVTPNVDHVIRYCEDPAFRLAYQSAAYILLDSRFLGHWLALTRGLRLHVCPGSDLTAHLIAHHLRPTDRVVLVGGTAAQAHSLRGQFGLTNLRHVDPPMGFIRDAIALESCLRAVESASPFRFCFLAVGSPQQEHMAEKLLQRGRAHGTALCVGASINFLTGQESRAPSWMQHIGFEWFYRLIRNPARLAHRYLLRGPRVFLMLPHLEIRPREVPLSSAPQPVNPV